MQVDTLVLVKKLKTLIRHVKSNLIKIDMLNDDHYDLWVDIGRWRSYQKALPKYPISITNSLIYTQLVISNRWTHLFVRVRLGKSCTLAIIFETRNSG